MNSIPDYTPERWNRIKRIKPQYYITYSKDYKCFTYKSPTILKEVTIKVEGVERKTKQRAPQFPRPRKTYRSSRRNFLRCDKRKGHTLQDFRRGRFNI